MIVITHEENPKHVPTYSKIYFPQTLLAQEQEAKYPLSLYTLQHQTRLSRWCSRKSPETARITVSRIAPMISPHVDYRIAGHMILVPL